MGGLWLFLQEENLRARVVGFDGGTRSRTAKPHHHHIGLQIPFFGDFAPGLALSHAETRERHGRPGSGDGSFQEITPTYIRFLRGHRAASFRLVRLNLSCAVYYILITDGGKI